jgi:hypothetical protein
MRIQVVNEKGETLEFDTIANKARLGALFGITWSEDIIYQPSRGRANKFSPSVADVTASSDPRPRLTFFKKRDYRSAAPCFLKTIAITRALLRLTPKNAACARRVTSLELTLAYSCDHYDRCLDQGNLPGDRVRYLLELYQLRAKHRPSETEIRAMPKDEAVQVLERFLGNIRAIRQRLTALTATAEVAPLPASSIPQPASASGDSARATTTDTTPSPTLLVSFHDKKAQATAVARSSPASVDATISETASTDGSISTPSQLSL